MKKPQIYLAGDICYKGSSILRDLEKKELENIGGRIYSPQEDKEINDKTNQTEDSNNGLAEKIVFKDTKAILESDIVIIEPQRFAEGTLVELGQVKGMKDCYKEVREYMQYLYVQGVIDVHTLADFQLKFNKRFNKTVYPHLEELRDTDIAEMGWRRSFYVNQYVHGVVLDLTEGVGFMKWKDILAKVKATQEDTVNIDE